MATRGLGDMRSQGRRIGLQPKVLRSGKTRFPPTEDWPKPQAAESSEESTTHCGSQLFCSHPPVPGEEEESRGGEAAPSHRSSRTLSRLKRATCPAGSGARAAL
eukprot:2289946-Rhodomonas_salina.1